MANRESRNATRTIPEVVEFKPNVHSDSRGYFAETYSLSALQRMGIDSEFVQDNQSLSRSKGTIRGLHFQSPPLAQSKLVRVLRGSIFDVAVDIRHGSPTFGRHIAIVISSDAWNQVFVPKGFAHGFCTLEPNTEVLYKVDAPYSPADDRGLLWSDPALDIDWPVPAGNAILSEKDQRHPRLADLPNYFEWSPEAEGVRT